MINILRMDFTDFVKMGSESLFNAHNGLETATTRTQSEHANNWIGDVLLGLYEMLSHVILFSM